MICFKNNRISLGYIFRVCGLPCQIEILVSRICLGDKNNQVKWQKKESPKEEGRRRGTKKLREKGRETFQRFALEVGNILTLFCILEDPENKNYRSNEPRVMDENQSVYVS